MDEGRDHLHAGSRRRPAARHLCRQCSDLGSRQTHGRQLQDATAWFASTRPQSTRPLTSRPRKVSASSRLINMRNGTSRSVAGAGTCALSARAVIPRPGLPPDTRRTHTRESACCLPGGGTRACSSTRAWRTPSRPRWSPRTTRDQAREGVALDHVQFLAVKVSRPVEPGLIREVNDVHDQRVALHDTLSGRHTEFGGMILNIPVGRVERLPDASEIRSSVGHSRGADRQVCTPPTPLSSRKVSVECSMEAPLDRSNPGYAVRARVFPNDRAAERHDGQSDPRPANVTTRTFQ